MLAFAFAVFLLLITPGPGVLSLAGVGTAYGWKKIEYPKDLNKNEKKIV